MRGHRRSRREVHVHGRDRIDDEERRYSRSIAVDTWSISRWRSVDGRTTSRASTFSWIGSHGRDLNNLVLLGQLGDDRPREAWSGRSRGRCRRRPWRRCPQCRGACAPPAPPRAPPVSARTRPTAHARRTESPPPRRPRSSPTPRKTPCVPDPRRPLPARHDAETLTRQARRVGERLGVADDDVEPGAGEASSSRSVPSSCSRCCTYSSGTTGLTNA